MHRIDVDFDFTLDTPEYWDNFWEKEPILGCSGGDPDSKSRTLQEYHKILWSRELPNHETMELSCGSGPNYLTWKNFRFGSDSIFVSFRYKKCKELLVQVSQSVPNYRSLIEDFLHLADTISGFVIFPKGKHSINKARGCNPLISDRWDWSLECIRLYYLGEKSPLYETLLHNKYFFDLFVDFKGYVEFFFLQDFVSEDYESVIMFDDKEVFRDTPRPQTPKEYVSWIKTQLLFNDRRKERIRSFVDNCVTWTLG